MAATHRWMHGRRATLASCRAAASSIGTPRVQALIGTPPSGWITSYERSLDMAGLLHSRPGSSPAGSDGGAPRSRSSGSSVAGAPSTKVFFALPTGWPLLIVHRAVVL